jgi:hypothetical protein
MSSWPPMRPERTTEAAIAAAEFPEPGAAAYGAAPPASRLPAASARPTALRAGLDPGDLCGP